MTADSEAAPSRWRVRRALPVPPRRLFGRTASVGFPLLETRQSQRLIVPAGGSAVASFEPRVLDGDPGAVPGAYAIGTSSPPLHFAVGGDAVRVEDVRSTSGTTQFVLSAQAARCHANARCADADDLAGPGQHSGAELGVRARCCEVQHNSGCGHSSISL